MIRPPRKQLNLEKRGEGEKGNGNEEQSHEKKGCKRQKGKKGEIDRAQEEAKFSRKASLARKICGPW